MIFPLSAINRAPSHNFSLISPIWEKGEKVEMTDGRDYLWAVDKVEPVAVSLPPATCRLPVRLPEHLCLVGHRVLLPDGVAEHGAEIRTGGAADSLYLPITLHKG